MSDFKKGEKIKLTNGDSITVGEKLGEGGQGAVYKVDYNGKDYALKWYLPNYLKGLNKSEKGLEPEDRCAKFYKNLRRNVDEGAPSPAFLWQKAIAVTGKQSNGFGYIMDLRPKDYAEFTSFLKAKSKFGGTQAVINAAINVVEAFQALHRKGLSYQDVSPGNFFINGKNGDVLICDNDNVAQYGDNLGVAGTPGYMAPEVILGQAKPSTDTDLFSLSVILFEMLFLSHPLEGANSCKHPCLTQQFEKELYAEKPVFVMSKTDHSNAPVKGVHNNLINLYPVYPEYLHEAFEKAFGEGLKNPSKRLSERDWLKVLYRLQDDAVRCPYCGELNFASMGNQSALKCTCCGKTYSVPYSASINGFEIVAGKDKTLAEYHVSHGDRNKAVATFMESKKTAGVFGLRNDSSFVWQVEYPGKPAMTYENGKVVTLIPETVITIGNNKVEIKK